MPFPGCQTPELRQVPMSEVGQEPDLSNESGIRRCIRSVRLVAICQLSPICLCDLLGLHQPMDHPRLAGAAPIGIHRLSFLIQ